MSPETGRGRVPTQCHEIRIQRSRGNPGDAYGRADVGQVWNKNGKRSHQHGNGGSGASGGMDAWAEMERASRTITTTRRRGVRCRRRPSRDDPGRVR